MPRTTKAPAKPAPSKALAVTTSKPPAPIDPATLEKALIGGDLGALNPAQRMEYYSAVCQSLQLNPLTRPLEFTVIDGKTLLYARKDCTEQLRRRDGIKIVIAERKTEGGLHWVTAKASLTSGREDEAIGVVPMEEPSFVTDWHPTERGKRIRVENPHKGKPLSAADRAKAMMLAETKAKRRVTLSIAGLGIPDESELEQHFEPSPEPTATAQAEENKIEKKIVKEGGTVTTISGNGETVEAEILKPENHADETERLLDVECHIGNAGGPWLGKKVRDMVPKVIALLYKDWLTKLPDKPLNKDARLRDAVKARKSIMEADGTWPKDAQEATPQPPEGQTTAPEPQKGKATAKRGKATPASEPAFDWKAVTIPMGALKGKPLGEISEDDLVSCYVYGLPLLTLDSDEEKAFDAGVRAGTIGKVGEDKEARHQLFIKFIEACGVKNMTAITAKLAACEIIPPGRTKLHQLTDQEVAYYLTNWETTKEVIK